MASVVPEQAELQQVSTLASMPRLAKRAATEALERRLDDLVGDPAVAAASARAIVDPADARRRLERLTPLRVPGGQFFALDTLVWSSAIVAYPTNNRLARGRFYPAGVEPGSSEAARYRPLRPPRDFDGEGAALVLHAQDQAHLFWSLERSAQFLADNNDLSESIGSKGVMVPVSVAVTVVTFAKDTDPLVLLTTPDGSSRVTGAQTVLGLTPNDVVVRLQQDERAHRQVVSQVQAALDRPAGEVSELDVRRLRALQVPARLLLRYEPDPTAPVTFAKAVEHYVHLVHVEPPTAWDEAGSLDAKADSVVAQLEAHRTVTPARREYLEGMLTPKEARTKKFAVEADERALEIVALLSSEKSKVKRAVRAGILELSPSSSNVRKEHRAQIAVELALRPVRALATPAAMKGARAALQSAYINAELWGRDLGHDGCTIEERRDAALKELEGGHPGAHCYRLGAQGAFWMAVQRILREARFFASETVRDSRQPQRVVDELVRTEWGVHTLYQAVVDGRDGQPIARVEKDGRRAKAVTGGVLTLSHEGLRTDVAPPAGPADTRTPSSNAVPALPTRMLLARRDEFRKALDRLEDAHAQLRDVSDTDGGPLVEVEGLPPDISTDMRNRLDDIRTSLALYAKVWEQRNGDDSNDEDAEVDPDVVSGKVSS
jgi:hypothetical protein